MHHFGSVDFSIWLKPLWRVAKGFSGQENHCHGLLSDDEGFTTAIWLVTPLSLLDQSQWVPWSVYTESCSI